MAQSPFYINRPPALFHLSHELLEAIAVDLEHAGITASPDALLRHIHRRNIVSRPLPLSSARGCGDGV